MDEMGKMDFSTLQSEIAGHEPIVMIVRITRWLGKFLKSPESKIASQFYPNMIKWI